MTLTELEKTILLSFFVLAKGSTRKYIPLNVLLSKFPIRQRKMVKAYVEALSKRKFLSEKNGSYRVEKKALAHISQFLIKGAKVRI